MFTRNDLIDVVMGHLGAKPGREAPVVRKRIFLTEHEIKKTLTSGSSRLTIPRNAIISPLAQEWLALKGIEIDRSDS